MCLETILHLLKMKYISSYQGFKASQYVDLQLVAIFKNTYGVIFSKQKVLRRRSQRVVAQVRINAHETMGR